MNSNSAAVALALVVDSVYCIFVVTFLNVGVNITHGGDGVLVQEFAIAVYVVTLEGNGLFGIAGATEVDVVDLKDTTLEVMTDSNAFCAFGDVCTVLGISAVGEIPLLHEYEVVGVE